LKDETDKPYFQLIDAEANIDFEASDRIVAVSILCSKGKAEERKEVPTLDTCILDDQNRRGAHRP
jgi:hypothetical protein